MLLITLCFPLPLANSALVRRRCFQFSEFMASTSGLAEAMDVDDVEGYKPPPEFEEDVKEPLIDLSLTDSTELWLLQLPYAQDSLADFDGQELSVNLHQDGQLASFEGPSGKVYDLVSYSFQVPDASVFASSAVEPKIIGKISRRVSVVHYPDPKEHEKASVNMRQAYHNSLGITTSSRYFPMQSSKLRSSQSGLTQGSRPRSTLSEAGEPSSTPKRSRSEYIASDNEPNEHTSNGRRTPNSGRGHSAGNSSVSSEHSRKGKSKKRQG